MKTKNSILIYPMIVIFFVFLSLYLITPKLYINHLKNQTETSFNTLIDYLEDGKNIKQVLNRYAVEENCYLSLENKQTHEQFETISIKTNHEYQYTKELTINQTPYTLTCIYANQTYPSLQTVLRLVLSTAAILLMLLMCILYAFFRPNEKDDYQVLFKKTKAMLNLEEDVMLPIDDASPLKNATYKNINELYSRLQKANQTIKNNRIDLQNATKSQQFVSLQNEARIKAPINEACRLISQAILSKQSFESKKIALIEAKLKLENIENDTKKTITSNHQEQLSVHQFFKQLCDAYLLEASKHKVGFSFHFEKDFKTALDTVLISEAFNHLMDYILRQCDDQSNIVVYQNHYDIIIAYKGACLTESSAELVRESDYHLVRFFNLIHQAKLFVDFSQTQRKDGMQFSIHF